MNKKFKVCGVTLFLEVETFPIYLGDDKIGEVDYPLDRSILDLIDDPLTLWASDNGYSVDELWCDF